MKEWKNTAEELLDRNRKNIDDADDSSMLPNKNIPSKLGYEKTFSTSSDVSYSPKNAKILEKVTPSHKTSFTSTKGLHMNLKIEKQHDAKANFTKENIAENHTSSSKSLSTSPLNYQDDSANIKRLISHHDKNENRIPPDLENEYESANTNDSSKSSPLTSQNSSFETGIKCKDKSSDPKFEMRGTNYWTLYNYIPADKVIK